MAIQGSFESKRIKTIYLTLKLRTCLDRAQPPSYACLRGVQEEVEDSLGTEARRGEVRHGEMFAVERVSLWSVFRQGASRAVECVSLGRESRRGEPRLGESLVVLGTQNRPHLRAP